MEQIKIATRPDDMGVFLEVLETTGVKWRNGHRPVIKLPLEGFIFFDLEEKTIRDNWDTEKSIKCTPAEFLQHVKRVCPKPEPVCGECERLKDFLMKDSAKISKLMTNNDDMRKYVKQLIDNCGHGTSLRLYLGARDKLKELIK